MPMASIKWKVVGGADKGGIIVRAREDLSSPQESARLSTGAIVHELRKSGERLHYELLAGSGPVRGWVSTQLKDKRLLVRYDEEHGAETSQNASGHATARLSGSADEQAAGSAFGFGNSFENARGERVNTKLCGTIDVKVLESPSGNDANVPSAIQDAESVAESIKPSTSGVYETMLEIAVRDILLKAKSGMTLRDVFKCCAVQVEGFDEARDRHLVRKLVMAARVAQPPSSTKKPVWELFGPRSADQLFSHHPPPDEHAWQAMEVGIRSLGHLALQSISRKDFGKAVETLSSEINAHVSAKQTARAGKDRSALLTLRAYAHWCNFQYAAAVADLTEAQNCHPVGPAMPLLAMAEYCLGVVSSNTESTTYGSKLRTLISEMTDFHRVMVVEYGRANKLFFPRKAQPYNDTDAVERWAVPGLQIFDGTCHVDPYGAEPACEIGYRMMVNRRASKHGLSQAPLLVYYHGNGEIISEYTQWADVYLNLPCTFVGFDYRGYGWSTGEPNYWNLTRDPDACISQLPNLLKRHGLPWPWPAPVVLMGRSMGGPVAASLTGKFPELFQGLILESAVANTKEETWMHMLSEAGPYSSELLAKMESVRTTVEKSLPKECILGQELFAPFGTCDMIKGYQGCVLVLHGELDYIVPPDHGRRNYEAVNCARYRDHVQIEADHNSCAGVPLFWKKQQEFLRMLMKGHQ